MVGKDVGGRKSWGGVGDDMQLISIAFSSTGYVRSTSPYHPHGVPISLTPPKITKSKTKQNAKQSITASFKQKASLTGTANERNSGLLSSSPILRPVNMVD
jgi:hypothetical protein